MEAEAWGRECLSCDWLRESICFLWLVLRWNWRWTLRSQQFFIKFWSFRINSFVSCSAFRIITRDRWLCFLWVCLSAGRFSALVVARCLLSWVARRCGSESWLFKVSGNLYMWSLIYWGCYVSCSGEDRRNWYFLICVPTILELAWTGCHWDLVFGWWHLVERKQDRKTGKTEETWERKETLHCDVYLKPLASAESRISAQVRHGVARL